MLTLENTSLKYFSPLSTEVHTDKNEFDPVFFLEYGSRWRRHALSNV